LNVLQKIGSGIGLILSLGVIGSLIFAFLNNSKIRELNYSDMRLVCKNAALLITGEAIDLSNAGIFPMGPAYTKVRGLKFSRLTWKSANKKMDLICDTQIDIADSQNRNKIVRFVLNGQDITEQIRREERK